MVQLDLDNVYLKITNLDKDPEMKLWNELSFQVQVYGQQEVHYRHLYNRKTKKTYAGLMDYVIDFFKKEEIDYQLIDHRTKHESNADFSLVDYIDKENNIELKLRPYQQEIVDNCREREVIQAATGAGKALPLYTPILTPDGWKPMEDIHVGDTVYDEDGKETKVIGEFPQGKLEVWELEFDDGNTIECSKDHLWKFCMVNKKSRKKSEWLEKTTEEMLELLNNNELFIPVVKPIEMSKKDLPYHPYLVGQLMAERDMCAGYWSDKFYEMTKGYSKEEFTKLIEFYDYEPYLWSTIEDRKEFLKGFADLTKNNKTTAQWFNMECEKGLEFLFQDKDNFYFISNLLKSMGFSPVEDDEECSLGILGIDDDFNVEYGNNEQMLYYHVENIYSIDHKTEMKCIAVDSPKKTYVCQDYIVTHNTLMMAAIIAKFNVKPVFVFADKIGLCMQLKQEIEKFLGVEVGLVGDGIEEYKDITVVSLQSAKEEQIQKAKMILFDECLPYDEQVMLADGTYMAIGEIVCRMEKGENFNVVSYNTEKKTLELNPVINFGKMPIENRKLVEVVIHHPETASRRTFVCTDNHKIYDKSVNMYVQAKDLIQGRKVVVLNSDNTLNEGIVEFVKNNIVYDLTVANNHNFVVNSVVVSNCHHIPSATCVDVANKCKDAYYRIGVSATPWRDAGDEMLIEACLARKKQGVSINASKLIELGYLVKPDIYFVPIKQVFKGKNYNALYNQAIVENNVRNKIIYKITEQMYNRDKHILILFKTIKHGEEMQKQLLKRLGEKVTPIRVINPKNGKETTIRVKNVEILSGVDDSLRRTAVFEAVKQGVCRCLLASTIADEGLDLPILDTLILAGGGKSSTRAFQRVGRVIRLYKDKTKAIVFDFIDYTPMLRRHSRARQKYYQTEPLWDIHKFVVNPD